MTKNIGNYQAPQIDVIFLVPESCILTASYQDSGAEDLNFDEILDI